NIQFICPSLKFILINTYRTPSRILVCSGSQFFEIASKEGTTQGDSLAMAMHSMAVVPLIKEVESQANNQEWFADDATSCDTSRTCAHSTIFALKRTNVWIFPKSNQVHADCQGWSA